MPPANAPHGPRSSLGRVSRPAQRSGRFGLLLLMLIASYLLSAFAHGTWVGAVQIALFLGVAALALRTSRVKRHTVLLVLSVVTGVSILLGALVLWHPTSDVQGAADAWKAVILAVAVIFIVGRVLAQPEVTIQSIYGAVSAYMVIGFMFASCYAVIGDLGEGDFFANGSPASVQTFQYFSFTTLTTLGYGDFTAANSGGRAIAVMEALLGQIFLATLVARLVAAFRAPGRGEGADQDDALAPRDGRRPAARRVPGPRPRPRPRTGQLPPPRRPWRAHSR
jgi:hypothetical protein